jgi:hypothetical protein
MAAVSRNYRTPRVPHRRDPGTSNIAFSEIRLPTEGGKELYGWWIPAERRENSPTLVLVHGSRPFSIGHFEDSPGEAE